MDLSGEVLRDIQWPNLQPVIITCLGFGQYLVLTIRNVFLKLVEVFVSVLLFREGMNVQEWDLFPVEITDNEEYIICWGLKIQWRLIGLSKYCLHGALLASKTGKVARVYLQSALSVSTARCQEYFGQVSLEIELKQILSPVNNWYHRCWQLRKFFLSPPLDWQRT